jgi:hypothetical protein
VLVFVMPFMAQGQNHQSKPTGAEPVPEPAIPAVLAAFDRYEVVAMPEAHGLKDLDDFILTLIRTPAFTEKVNDIEVECGNSLYQPILDRYIGGEDVPFKEVQKVWRNTTQDMCGTSMFFEEFFPIVRGVNQKVPQNKRIRVLAGDPPIDWEEVKSLKDTKKLAGRDETAASVLEKEVLLKHRKALMLFGTLHLAWSAWCCLRNRDRTSRRCIRNLRLGQFRLEFPDVIKQPVRILAHPITRANKEHLAWS